MSSSSASVATALGSVAVLVLILYRQLQVRAVTTTLTVPAVLVIAGTVALAGASRGVPLTTHNLAGLLLALAVDAVGLGAVRAYTLRLWNEGGAWHRQGTWLTASLWLVGTGMHVALDTAMGFGAASALLYLGVTYAAQRLVVQHRVAVLVGNRTRRIAPDGPTRRP